MLNGKISKMTKPLLVLRKQQLNNNSSQLSGTADDLDVTSSQQMETSYDVTAVITKKIVFKTRPNPIVANVPKTL